jgi:hypothetical protein
VFVARPGPLLSCGLFTYMDMEKSKEYGALLSSSTKV